MPEAEASSRGDEPIDAAPRVPVKPPLARVELELPDGRYLLAYSRPGNAPADA